MPAHGAAVAVAVAMDEELLEGPIGMTVLPATLGPAAALVGLAAGGDEPCETVFAGWLWSASRPWFCFAARASATSQLVVAWGIVAACELAKSRGSSLDARSGKLGIEGQSGAEDCSLRIVAACAVQGV
mmetsp:Transcript_132089/g.381895  ORF Transcript_132089/g.381895 Transcript_132089/m.381895 type:complete len:129 (+) Transcript_132089:783-1169(+)